MEKELHPTKLYIANIPPEFNNMTALQEHFEEFGDITQVSCMVEKQIALVGFATPEESSAALASSKPVCGNRFITVKRADAKKADLLHHSNQKQGGSSARPTIVVVSGGSSISKPSSESTNTTPSTSGRVVVVEKAKPATPPGKARAARLKEIEEQMNSLRTLLSARQNPEPVAEATAAGQKRNAAEMLGHTLSSDALDEPSKKLKEQTEENE
jgi:hypothetical protein